jgi:outer membrane protein assembly factor BamB
MSAQLRSIHVILTATFALALACAADAADWYNSGGNAGRNCMSTEIGPVSDEDLLWSGGRQSIIAWQPVIEGDRVFMVRQTGFPQSEPGASPVVAMDLNTGDELWAIDIPFNEGDWTTWVAGVKDGLVYASRAGNGATVSALLYALDATDGSTVWVSDDEIDAGMYDGVVFAPNGDPIIASFRDIWRINHLDGSTVWHEPRQASVSGNCGAAIYGDAIYVAESAPGGQVITRFDLATGAEMYESELMDGFLVQNTPMVGPDGTIYFARVQNNPLVDYFYALEDDGTQITIKWSVPSAYCVSSEYGIGPDGSVYMMMPGPELVRLDPATGTVLDTAGVIDGFSKPRMAVDADGKVYFGNGAFATGRLYCFTAELDPIWDVQVTNINIGGPALGSNGTLVVCGIGTDVRAYRTEAPPCPADVNGDGFADVLDLLAVITAWGASGGPEDINGDGIVDVLDLLAVITAWGAC